MSKRATRLNEILNYIDVAQGVVDEVSDKINGVLESVRDKVDAQYEQASANDAYETEAEQRAAETVKAVTDLFKKAQRFVNNPNAQSFFDAWVSPETEAGVPDEEEPKAEAKDLSREGKISFVRDYYHQRFGMNIWPTTETISDDFLDRIYDQISNL